jgi:hypothetical protein
MESAKQYKRKWNVFCDRIAERSAMGSLFCNICNRSKRPNMVKGGSGSADYYDMKSKVIPLLNAMV